MKRYTKLSAFLLSLTLALSLTACKTRSEPEPVEVPAPEPPKAVRFMNPLNEDFVINTNKFPKYTEKVKEYKQQNGDTVGWLEVPGTTINDVVVCYTAPGDNNNYYYRLDFNKNYSEAGVLYADFRTKFGDYTAEQLPMNTVIYGHTLQENRDHVMFAPLLYFMDEEFAENTPYVYFSTEKEDLVFEVFAVSFAHVDIPYNRPDISGERYQTVIKSMRDRSIYNYDVEVGPEDKILTLSTCTYRIPGIGPVVYPNDYRYVILAKLVDKSTAVKKQADMSVNPEPMSPNVAA